MFSHFRTTKNYIPFLLSATWICGMLFSMEFILSLSMMGWMLYAVLESNGKRRIQLRTDVASNIRKTVTSDWCLLSVPFLLVLMTAVYSTDDVPYLLERLRIKIPYLILPFAFLSIPRVSKKTYHSILLLFSSLVTLTSIGVTVNYVLNYHDINTLLSQGQPMPTPTSHVRYSLMVVLAIFQAVSIALKMPKGSANRIGLLGIACWLVLFIHILSVRSGIAIFYIVAFLGLVRYIMRSKQYIVGLLSMLLLVSLPVVAYYTMPSLQAKVNYMIWDLQQYATQGATQHSDAGRLTSLKLAAAVIQEHPVFGVGAGDVRYVMQEQYAEYLPHLTQESRKMPHNEYVSVWLGAGLVGLIIFIFSNIYPLWHQKRYRNETLLLIQIVILLSFLVENTIENAVGIGVHLLFLLLGMRMSENTKSE